MVTHPFRPGRLRPGAEIGMEIGAEHAEIGPDIGQKIAWRVITWRTFRCENTAPNPVRKWPDPRKLRYGKHLYPARMARPAFRG